LRTPGRFVPQSSTISHQSNANPVEGCQAFVGIEKRLNRKEHRAAKPQPNERNYLTTKDTKTTKKKPHFFRLRKLRALRGEIPLV
jgi:hypothetical protein